MNISTPTEVHAWPSREEGYSPLEYSFTQVFWAGRERERRKDGRIGGLERGMEGRMEGWKDWRVGGRDGREEIKKESWERESKGEGSDRGKGGGKLRSGIGGRTRKERKGGREGRSQRHQISH